MVTDEFCHYIFSPASLTVCLDYDWLLLCLSVCSLCLSFPWPCVREGSVYISMDYGRCCVRWICGVAEQWHVSLPSCWDRIVFQRMFDRMCFSSTSRPKPTSSPLSVGKAAMADRYDGGRNHLWKWWMVSNHTPRGYTQERRVGKFPMGTCRHTCRHLWLFVALQWIWICVQCFFSLLFFLSYLPWFRQNLWQASRCRYL